MLNTGKCIFTILLVVIIMCPDIFISKIQCRMPPVHYQDHAVCLFRDMLHANHLYFIINFCHR